MRRSFFAFIISLTLVSSACAESMELLVTPTKLDAYVYAFSVLTNATRDGVAFDVIITSKQNDIYPDSGADVDMVIHKSLPNGGLEGSVGPVEQAIPVALKKEKRVWKADFTIPRELLKNPDVCFVFRVPAHDVINGKTVLIPSADFYELRLQDFAKP